MLTNQSRILSIDPTSRGFAFAVLEGPERLIDCGTVGVRPLEEHLYLAKLDVLITYFEPHVLVLEDPRGPGSRRRGRAISLIRSIELLAWRRRVPVVRISRGQVQALYKESGSTKQQIAEAIARWFSELEPKLPKKRRTWEPEHHRMDIFDAISFALVAFRIQSKEGEAS